MSFQSNLLLHLKISLAYAPTITSSKGYLDNLKIEKSTGLGEAKREVGYSGMALKVNKFYFELYFSAEIVSVVKYLSY